MGKKGSKPMTWEAARRIQSAVDSGRAVKADEGFKARAMSAAARNSKNNDDEFEDWVVEEIMLASEEGTDVDDIFDIGNWF
ncbi:hypothetical protein [Thermococcus eurythermalis]|uniref:hypothetical protein n=1 Tax=Thermococcus eurythermalis TaxID=1505907 RepID=UPI000679DD5F|nr:hypothetical protein [Thermococcus eurythermalis]